MFPANTQIKTLNQTVMIDELVERLPGLDKPQVLAYDTTRQRPTESEVLMTRSSDSRDFILIQFSRGENLVITPKHKLYDVENRQWVSAENIQADTRCTTTNGFSYVVKKHKIQNHISEKVYTLTVDTQNFFANQVLVRG